MSVLRKENEICNCLRSPGKRGWHLRCLGSCRNKSGARDAPGKGHRAHFRARSVSRHNTLAGCCVHCREGWTLCSGTAGSCHLLLALHMHQIGICTSGRHRHWQAVAPHRLSLPEHWAAAAVLRCLEPWQDKDAPLQPSLCCARNFHSKGGSAKQ